MISRKEKILGAANGLCVATAAIALASCKPQSGSGTKEAMPIVVEAQWTDAAASRAEDLVKAGKMRYSLPGLRVYDRDGRLVYLLDPSKTWTPASIGADIDKALPSGRMIPGPSLQETLSELQAGGNTPNVAAGIPVVVDYWASWCVPCKELEKSLLGWQAQKEPGSIQIVKAETDLLKLERSRGKQIFFMKKGPDGKLHKVPA